MHNGQQTQELKSRQNPQQKEMCDIKNRRKLRVYYLSVDDWKSNYKQA